METKSRPGFHIKDTVKTAFCHAWMPDSDLIPNQINLWYNESIITNLKACHSHLFVFPHICPRKPSNKNTENVRMPETRSVGNSFGS